MSNRVRSFETVSISLPKLNPSTAMPGGVAENARFAYGTVARDTAAAGIHRERARTQQNQYCQQ